jgi:hypothetical protein
VVAAVYYGVALTRHAQQTLAHVKDLHHMATRSRFRLSTMEIVLIGTLLGGLALAFLQARWEERHTRLIEEIGDGH